MHLLCSSVDLLLHISWRWAGIKRSDKSREFLWNIPVMQGEGCTDLASWNCLTLGFSLLPKAFGFPQGTGCLQRRAEWGKGLHWPLTVPLQDITRPGSKVTENIDKENTGILFICRVTSYFIYLSFLYNLFKREVFFQLILQRQRLHWCNYLFLFLPTLSAC